MFSVIAKLYLDGYGIEDFNYLNCGSLDFNPSQDATRFEAWKVGLIDCALRLIDYCLC